MFGQRAGSATTRRRIVARWIVPPAIFLIVFIPGWLLISPSPTPNDTPVLEGPAIDWSIIGGPHPLFWYAGRPNLDNARVTGVFWEPVTGDRVELDFTVSTNRYGFRDDPIAPKGTRFRILAIGDSTTFGHGVDRKDTWPDSLERRLTDSGYRVDVINAGQCAHTAFQGKLLMEHIAPELEPDLVLVNYGHNELLHWDGLSDYERHALRDPDRPGVFSDAQQALSAKRKTELGEAEWKRVPRMDIPDYKRALEEIVAAARDIDADVALMAWPTRNDFIRLTEGLVGQFKSLLMLTYFQFTVETASALDVPVIDVVEAVDRDASVLMDTVHFLPRGNHRVAEYLAEWLIESGYLRGYAGPPNDTG